jgi:DNA-binding LacI/PurR family transcriptional regulator
VRGEQRNPPAHVEHRGQRQHADQQKLLPITGAAEDVLRVTEAAVDGFIVWTTSDDDPVVAAVRSTRRPAVVHGGPALSGLELVSIDNRAAARAIGTMAFAGATRPAILSQPLSRDRISMISRGAEINEVSFPVTRDRLAGYREAAEAAGFTWDDVLIAVCAHNDVIEAEQITAALLASTTPPDAIAAMSDQQAAGVVRAARAAGRLIPDELAVTGWDDAAVAAQLELTTVAQSLRDQGSACAHAALDNNPTPMRRRGLSFAEPAPAADRPKVSCLLERLIPDSSRVFLDDVDKNAFAAARRPVAD